MRTRSVLSLSLMLVFAVVLGACGGGGNDQPAQTQQATQSSGGSSGSGNIVATVNFEGQAPEPETFDASGNSECGESTLESREVVVNDNGTLKNAVLAVKSGPSGLDRSPEDVSVDQVNCMYEPHVVTAKVGQSITFDDSDPSMHNVRATQDGRQVFNLTTFKGNGKTESFSSPGAYSLECDVHPWMQGWVYVTEHGYATPTDDSGKAQLSDLPAGEYTVEVWHEKYGTTTETVTVEDGGTAEISVSFSE